MSELFCPHCQNRVRLSNPEVNTPYLCKKCYTPFYMNARGVAVVGQPPRVDDEVEALKQQIRQALGRIPKGWVLAGLAMLVVVSVVAYVLRQPVQNLEGFATEAAQALADGDLATLRSFAAPGTAEDVARWYETIHPRLAQARESWSGRAETVEVHLGRVDPAERMGETVLSIQPAVLGSTRDVALSGPASVAAEAEAPFNVEAIWTLNRWGRWKLDGRATYARSQPTP